MARRERCPAVCTGRSLRTPSQSTPRGWSLTRGGQCAPMARYRLRSGAGRAPRRPRLTCARTAMELRRRVEDIDRLRGDFEGMAEELDGLVVHVPASAVGSGGVGSIDLTAGLRGIAAERRGLGVGRERGEGRDELLGRLHGGAHLVVGQRQVAREDPVATGLHLLRRRGPAREDHGEGDAECEEEGAHRWRCQRHGVTDRRPSRNHRARGPIPKPHGQK